MKKLLVVLGLLVLVPGLAFAQGSYYVDYYANNFGYAPDAEVSYSLDQIVRIINAGTQGNPLTVPRGDICANIYVFDADQEMIACCAERLTPNELDSAYVGKQLTSNTVTYVIPRSGVIKIALTPDPTGASCDPRNPLTGADAALGVVFGTHLQYETGYYYVTETEKRSSPLGPDEAAFLPQACSFAWYLGSGFGVCTSTVSSGQR
jgi:hypothetical protein